MQGGAGEHGDAACACRVEPKPSEYPTIAQGRARTDPEVDDAAVERGLQQLEGDAHEQQRERVRGRREEVVVALLEQHPAHAQAATSGVCPCLVSCLALLLLIPTCKLRVQQTCLRPPHMLQAGNGHARASWSLKGSWMPLHASIQQREQCRGRSRTKRSIMACNESKREGGGRARLVLEGEAQLGHGAHGEEHDGEEGDAKVGARVVRVDRQVREQRADDDRDDHHLGSAAAQTHHPVEARYFSPLG